METTEELKLGISEQDELSEMLQPKEILVKNVTIEEVGEKKNKKIVLHCQHPDNPDLIKISEAKVERTGKLELVGLWLNKNKIDGKIRKTSGLAKFLIFFKCNVIEDLIMKSLPTLQTDKGYLAIKSY